MIPNDLHAYFESTCGTGVLATADAQGQPNLALFARPHIRDESVALFVMGDRLTRRNLLANPRAAYLFVEEGEGWHGVRLVLTRVGESQDRLIIESFRRRKRRGDEIGEEKLYLVEFRIDAVRPLVGGGEMNWE